MSNLFHSTGLLTRPSMTDLRPSGQMNFAYVADQSHQIPKLRHQFGLARMVARARLRTSARRRVVKRRIPLRPERSLSRARHTAASELSPGHFFGFSRHRDCRQVHTRTGSCRARLALAWGAPLLMELAGGHSAGRMTAIAQERPNMLPAYYKSMVTLSTPPQLGLKEPSSLGGNDDEG